MKGLQQVTVIGLGLLGGSVSLAISRCFSSVKVVGYAHRKSTRRKAKNLAIATELASDIKSSVRGSDIVILASPVRTFEQIFRDIADALSPGTIVTDVGSTKLLPYRWAKKILPRHTYYVGSHPIAGSEQRGVEFARDDLFERALCILTKMDDTNSKALTRLKRFWEQLGCQVKIMRPAEHDRIFAYVSHLPHITAAALLNANNNIDQLKFAGKGFIDTSRIASGPANVWTDIFMTNTSNCIRAISKLQQELEKFKQAISADRYDRIEKFLEQARNKRFSLIKYKLKNKELLP